MRKVDLLLEAMDVLDIDVSVMEINSAIEVGSLQAIIDDNEKDLPEDMITKIAKTYGADFLDVGFCFLDGSAFNQEGTLFVKRDISIRP
jgi:hypothetical protein